MSTLFERVSGVSEDKIPIHLIRSCMSEMNAGRMSIGDAVANMELTAGQTAHLGDVLTAAKSSSDSSTFSSRVFAYLVLSEMDVAGYRDEAAFWTMIADEGSK